MELEQSLAAERIAKELREGYGLESAIAQTVRFLQTQGFSKAHSIKTAREMAELVA